MRILFCATVMFSIFLLSACGFSDKPVDSPVGETAGREAEKQIEESLQYVFEKYIGAWERGNGEEVVSLCSGDMERRCRDLFAEASSAGALAGIVSQLKNFSLGESNGEKAVFVWVDDEELMEYEIILSRSNDGRWLISNF